MWNEREKRAVFYRRVAAAQLALAAFNACTPAYFGLDYTLGQIEFAVVGLALALALMALAARVERK